MAHPLNRPRFGPGQRRVVEGLRGAAAAGDTALPGREGSFFQRLSSGRPASIVRAAVSDVYQDLLGGRLVYRQGHLRRGRVRGGALAGRVPDKRPAQPRSIRGVFARAGLVTDVELFESAPSHYGVAAARQHRWARGDWQLLPWILGAGSRWSDAGRCWITSVAPYRAPAAFLTLVVAWVMPGTSPRYGVPSSWRPSPCPPSCQCWAAWSPRARHLEAQPHSRGRPGSSSWPARIRAHGHDADAPDWLMSDAIVRTLVRVYVTHRGLLEW